MPPVPAMLPPQCPLWRVPVGSEPAIGIVGKSSKSIVFKMSIKRKEDAAPYVGQI